MHLVCLLIHYILKCIIYTCIIKGIWCTFLFVYICSYKLDFIRKWFKKSAKKYSIRMKTFKLKLIQKETWQVHTGILKLQKLGWSWFQDNAEQLTFQVHYLFDTCCLFGRPALSRSCKLTKAVHSTSLLRHTAWKFSCSVIQDKPETKWPSQHWSWLIERIVKSQSRWKQQY